ncbi:hypothetical protein AB1K56_13310 [Microbacterium sp. BWR-S6Y]|uniref:hypothetical protein n=1 Tax=Microbacterium sp. BWR-S6Y TaxID=3232073 RepID=UPI003528A963
MRSLTVITDTLRRAAGSLDLTARAAEAETAVADARQLGHGQLGQAVDAFMQAMTGGWTEATAQVDDTAAGLRESAGLYERVEEGSDATIRALAGDT